MAFLMSGFLKLRFNLLMEFFRNVEMFFGNLQVILEST